MRWSCTLTETDKLSLAWHSPRESVCVRTGEMRGSWENIQTYGSRRHVNVHKAGTLLKAVVPPLWIRTAQRTAHCVITSYQDEETRDYTDKDGLL